MVDFEIINGGLTFCLFFRFAHSYGLLGRWDPDLNLEKGGLADFLLQVDTDYLNYSFTLHWLLYTGDRGFLPWASGVAM